ncbi:MAG: hypothetical protein M3357_09190 [Actinomycetota bacterium]|nr:hypothetical protein [Actinomycetota bacterium]
MVVACPGPVVVVGGAPVVDVVVSGTARVVDVGPPPGSVVVGASGPVVLAVVPVDDVVAPDPVEQSDPAAAGAIVLPSPGEAPAAT